MDKIRVLIADNDLHYRETLTAVLTRLAPSFTFACPPDGSRISYADTLLLYDPADHAAPPPGSHAIRLVHFKDGSSGSSGPDWIYRYASACDFALMLDEYVKSHPELTASSLSGGNLCCIAGQACWRSRREAILRLADAKSAEGYIPVLIDLCPRHECLIEPEQTGDRSTLSDAMLAIMSGGLPYEEIGIYMAPSDRNILHFRPFDCSDDLYECLPDHVRILADTLRKWNAHTAYAHCIMIHCGSIPFSFIYKISILCDSLILLNHSEEGFRAHEYGKELSGLIANLPVSCDVIRQECSCIAEGGCGYEGGRT